MNYLVKAILATSLINAVILGGVSAQASIRSQANLVSQNRPNTRIAEASDGDGEMNDAMEAQLEKKNSQENTPIQASKSDRHPTVSQDTDGGNETREIKDEPNDADGGNETQEAQ